MPGATPGAMQAMHGAAGAAERRDGRARPVVRAAPPSPLFGGDADDGGVAAVGAGGGAGRRRRARSGDSITMHIDDPSQCLKSP
jgi:hypothetical protein